MHLLKRDPLNKFWLTRRIALAAAVLVVLGLIAAFYLRPDSQAERTAQYEVLEAQMAKSEASSQAARIEKDRIDAESF